jgi:hypothetical protein
VRQTGTTTSPLRWRSSVEPWGRQSDIAAFVAHLLVQTGNIGAAIARTGSTWPQHLPLDQLLEPAERKVVADDPLLIALLESGHVPDRALERFLTLLRSALLETTMTVTETDQIDEDGLRLCNALSRLCFLNDYVYSTIIYTGCFPALDFGRSRSATRSTS